MATPTIVSNAVRVGVLTLAPLLAAAESSLLWFEGNRLTSQGRDLTALLEDAQAYGLSVRDYELPLAASARAALYAQSAPAATQRLIDAALTDAGARFVRDVSTGRVEPRRKI